MHFECAVVIGNLLADSIRDRSIALHTKSGCMAAIFTFSKSSIESLAKVGVHVCSGARSALAVHEMQVIALQVV